VDKRACTKHVGMHVKKPSRHPVLAKTVAGRGGNFLNGSPFPQRGGGCCVRPADQAPRRHRFPRVLLAGRLRRAWPGNRPPSRAPMPRGEHAPFATRPCSRSDEQPRACLSRRSGGNITCFTGLAKPFPIAPWTLLSDRGKRCPSQWPAASDRSMRRSGLWISILFDAHQDFLQLGTAKLTRFTFALDPP